MLLRFMRFLFRPSYCVELATTEKQTWTSCLRSYRQKKLTTHGLVSLRSHVQLRRTLTNEFQTRTTSQFNRSVTVLMETIRARCSSSPIEHHALSLVLFVSTFHRALTLFCFVFRFCIMLYHVLFNVLYLVKACQIYARQQVAIQRSTLHQRTRLQQLQKFLACWHSWTSQCSEHMRPRETDLI